jgi:hypothetical protein
MQSKEDDFRYSEIFELYVIKRSVFIFMKWMQESLILLKK